MSPATPTGKRSFACTRATTLDEGRSPPHPEFQFEAGCRPDAVRTRNVSGTGVRRATSVRSRRRWPWSRPRVHELPTPRRSPRAGRVCVVGCEKLAVDPSGCKCAWGSPCDQEGDILSAERWLASNSMRAKKRVAARPSAVSGCKHRGSEELSWSFHVAMRRFDLSPPWPRRRR